MMPLPCLQTVVVTGFVFVLVPRLGGRACRCSIHHCGVRLQAQSILQLPVLQWQSSPARGVRLVCQQWQSDVVYSVPR